MLAKSIIFTLKESKAWFLNNTYPPVEKNRTYMVFYIYIWIDKMHLSMKEIWIILSYNHDYQVKKGMEISESVPRDYFTVQRREE